MKRFAVVGAAVAAAVAVAGVALATIPREGVISACYQVGGFVRVIDAATAVCGKNESSLAWNVQGPQGSQGVQGAAGPAGTSDVYHASNVSLIREPSWTLPVSVPAGNYLVLATVEVHNENSVPMELSCGRVDGWSTSVELEANRATTIPIVDTVTLASPGTIAIICDGPGLDLTAAKLTATRVTTLHP